MGYGWFTIVDIPIGTAEVTASRESLSYDDDTIKVTNEVYDTAYNELFAQVNGLLAKAVTRIDKARLFGEYNGVLDNLRGSTLVSLQKQNPDYSAPGEIIERAEHFGKSSNCKAHSRFVSGIEHRLLDRFCCSR